MIAASRRRLLIRPGAIGDFILSLPAMESLRAEYTEVWCAEQNVPLAVFANRAVSLGASGIERLGFLPSGDVLERLSAFDSIISWYGTTREDFQKLVAALPFQFLRALPAGRLHAVDFYNAQARELGGIPARFPVIACPPADRTFAAIHPFASSMAKRAPMTYFEELACRLSRSMPVHWLAGPEETLPEAIRIPNLLDLAHWLSQAKLFVGNDSGISHLAAAVGTPVIARFLTTDPKIWSPRGPSVHVVTGSEFLFPAVPSR